jgi:ParB family chromosome partitioning protein
MWEETDMSLRDKASKLDFSALPGLLQPKPGDGSRPKTAPGAMMAFANDARSELLRENDELRAEAGRAEEIKSRLDEALVDLAQWEGAKATRLIDPALIARSRFANRHELNFDGPEFAQLKREISEAGGNVQPIKVRLVGGAKGTVRYEIVFGHRRHEACRQLGLEVAAVIDNVDDRALFVEMDRENRARKDLSAWEQGVMYKRALDEGLFPSNRKLAEAVGADLGAVGKAIELASLDPGLVAAFESPLDLQYRWSKPLREAWRRDPEGLSMAAKAIAEMVPRPSAKTVFERLTAAGAKGVEPFNPPSELPINLKGSQVALLTAHADGEVTVVLKAGILAAANHRALAEAIEVFLHRAADSKHSEARPISKPE